MYRIVPFLLTSVILLRVATANAWSKEAECSGHENDLYFSRPDTLCSSDLDFLEPDNDPTANLRLLLKQYLVQIFETEAHEAFATNADPILESCRVSSKKAMEDNSSSYFDYIGINKSSSSYEKGVYPGDDYEEVQLGKIMGGRLTPCGSTVAFEDWAVKLNSILQTHTDRKTSHEWLDYLKASRVLASGGSVEGVALLYKLRGSTDHWLRETAMYLRGRGLLEWAQREWNQYTERLATIDQESLRQAQKALTEYRESFPSGRYLKSVLGFQRLADRLSQDEESYKAALLSAFELAIANGTREELELVTKELQNVLADEPDALPTDPSLMNSHFIAAHPLLAADMILLKYGTITHHAFPTSETTLEALDGARGSFERYPGLIEVLRGYVLIRLSRSEEAARFEIKKELPLSMIGKSLRIAKAKALEAISAFDEARTLWQELLTEELRILPDRPGVDDGNDGGPYNDGMKWRIRVALLRNRLLAKRFLEIASAPEGLYADVDQVYRQAFRDDTLREILASAQTTAANKERAAKALLNNWHIRGKFKDFTTFMEGQNNSVQKAFESVALLIRTLSENPDDAAALFEYAIWQSRQSYRILPPGTPDRPSRDDWTILNEFYGGPGFKGYGEPSASYQPFEYFKRAKSAADGAAQADLELKAHILVELIGCNNEWKCSKGAHDDLTPDQQRDQWLAELKEKYSDTYWAKTLITPDAATGLLNQYKLAQILKDASKAEELKKAIEKMGYIVTFDSRGYGIYFDRRKPFGLLNFAGR